MPTSHIGVWTGDVPNTLSTWLYQTTNLNLLRRVRQGPYEAPVTAKADQIHLVDGRHPIVVIDNLSLYNHPTPVVDDRSALQLSPSTSLLASSTVDSHNLTTAICLAINQPPHSLVRTQSLLNSAHVRLCKRRLYAFLIKLTACPNIIPKTSRVMLAPTRMEKWKSWRMNSKPIAPCPPISSDSL